MGFLTNGWQGVAQGFAGQPDAASLAQRSLQWGSASAGLATAAPFAQALAQRQFYDTQASIADEGAQATRLAGSYQESALKSKFTQLGAAQEAAQAANGIEVGSGSAQRVRQATANTGALDAAMLHYNTMREAMGLSETARYDRAAGNQALIGGLLNTGGTFLSSAASLSDKWLRYQQDFGPGVIK